MMWCHYSPEWFDSSFNFPNCAVRILDSSIPGWDGGGLFGGFNRCVCLAVCLSVSVYVCICVCQPVCLSVTFSAAELL